MRKNHVNASFSVKSMTNESDKLATFEGYGSQFTIDRCQDKMAPGSFKASLASHAKRDNRMVRMFAQHNYDIPIGGFPLDSISEDSKGLFLKGEINLQIQRGFETRCAMEQGTMTDLSIGGRIKDAVTEKGVRIIKEFDLHEISVVSEPMNMDATITSKAVTPFLDLPLAPRETEYNAEAADNRVRAFTNSQNAPSNEYREAFFYYDEDEADSFSAYELQYADVIDDALVAIPEAIFFAAGQIESGIGVDNIPASERAEVVKNISKYYEKMGLDDPFEADDFQASFSLKSAIKDLSTIKNLDGFLRKHAKLTNSERDFFIIQLKKLFRVEPQVVTKRVEHVDEIKAMSTQLNQLLATMRT